MRGFRLHTLEGSVSAILIVSWDLHSGPLAQKGSGVAQRIEQQQLEGCDSVNPKLLHHRNIRKLSTSTKGFLVNVRITQPDRYQSH